MLPIIYRNWYEVLGSDTVIIAAAILMAVRDGVKG
jgi:hypothetical protein